MPVNDVIRVPTVPGAHNQTLMDGLVHEVAGRMASRVNNEGLKDQVEFLNANGMDDEAIQQWLKEANDA